MFQRPCIEIPLSGCSSSISAAATSMVPSSSSSSSWWPTPVDESPPTGSPFRPLPLPPLQPPIRGVGQRSPLPGQSLYNAHSGAHCSQWSTMSSNNASASTKRTEKAKAKAQGGQATTTTMSTSWVSTRTSAVAKEACPSLPTPSTTPITKHEEEENDSNENEEDSDEEDPAYLPTPPTTPLRPHPHPMIPSFSLSLSPLQPQQPSSSSTAMASDDMKSTSSSSSSSLRLPNELLTHVFSTLPPASLARLMRVDRHFHAVAERLLYHTLTSVQLFASLPDDDNDDDDDTDDDDDDGTHPNGDHDDEEESWMMKGGNTKRKLDPSWRLLFTLCERPSAARAVRHFAVKGLPWWDSQREVQVLVRAIRQMTGLVSLEIELGVEVEKALVRGLIREEQEREHQERAEEEDQELGWTSLSALNVMNVQTALYFLGYRDDVDVDGGEEEGERRRQQPRQCRRQRQCRRRSPITVLRLDSREPVDAEMLWLLTMHLRRAGGNQDEDGEREEEETTVKSLQLALRCGSAAEFGTMLDRLAKDVPHVETLGLHLACPTTNTTATTTSATTTPALSSSFSSFSSFHPFSSPSPSPTSPSPSSSSFVWSEVTAAAAAAAAAAGAGVGDRRRLASTPSMDVFPTLAKGIAPFARLHTFSLALVAPSPFHFSSGTMTSPPPSPTTTLPHPHPASANYGTRGTTTTVSSSAGAGTGGVMGLDVEALTIGCGPQLRLVELQWDAWRMNTTTHTQTQTQTPMMMPIMTTSANQGVSSSASPSTIPSSTCRRKWEPITVNKNRHPFLRREWAYKVAEPASYWW